MAQGRVEREPSSFSNFSILDGVMVKIGEKFCPPKQVVLPSGVIRKEPTKLLEFSYDFSLEERVIAISEEEKRLKEVEISKATAESDAKDDSINSATDSSDELHETSPGSSNETQQSLIPTSDILTPISIPVSPKESNTKKNKSYNDFNLSEFEDNNATPFELVELLTINDLDELKSVLQPEQGKSTRKQNTTICSQPISTSASISESSINTPGINDGTFSFLSSGNIFNGHVAGESSRGDVFTNNSQVACNSNLLINTQDNDTTGGGTLLDMTPMGQSVPEHPSSTNLTSTNSKSLPSLATGNIPQTGSQNQPHEFVAFSGLPETRLPPNSIQDEVVPTQRVNDIMRQYQFTRMPDNLGYSMVTENQGGVPVARDTDPNVSPSPFSRHGHLPPMSHSSVPDMYSGVQSVRYNVSDGSLMIANKLPRGPNSPKLEPLADDIKVCSKGPDIRKPQTPIIPPIRHSYSYVTGSVDAGQTISQNVNDALPHVWLPDPTAQLTEAEKGFVHTMAAMGFPLVRTARAVKRLGTDEKQVVEFLVHVQQVSDMGYNGDDVEVALIDNKNIDEALKYLQVFRTLKEFGFIESNIQDALRRTAGDRDAALEILMS